MALSLTMFDSVVRIWGDLPDNGSWDRTTTKRRVIGSGFLCGVPSRRLPGERYGYVITAHHVIDGQAKPQVQAPFPLSNGSDLQDPVDVTDWEQPLTGVDMAIAGFDGRHGRTYGGLVTDRHFLRPGQRPSLGGPLHYIGILTEPEDRVMARSGTVGALDQVGLKSPKSRNGTSYSYTAHLADCRTYGGFSGSPVFAEYTAPVLEQIDESLLPPTSRHPSDKAPRGSIDHYAWVCGMLTWHLTDDTPEQSKYGVVAILPHDEILRGLMSLQHERDEADEKNLARAASTGPQARNASADSTDETDEFARFQDLTRKLVNTPKPDKESGGQ